MKQELFQSLGNENPVYKSIRGSQKKSKYLFFLFPNWV